MDEKMTMTATFEPTLDVFKLLEGKPTEYIVVNPTIIEAKLRSGEVKRYPQDIRERIVRCRDCVNSFSHICGLCCGNFSNLEDGHYEVVTPEGFCAWGEPREEEF